jgi:hypothetical protein
VGSRTFEGETAADQQAQRPESVLPASATQHLLALQRTAGNHAVVRLLAPAAPRTASLSAILSNPAAAQAAAGNRATGRVLARKKTGDEVKKTLTSDVLKTQIEKVVEAKRAKLRSEALKKKIEFDETMWEKLTFADKIAMVLADSEASYTASLKRGERLLKIVEKYAEVIASAAEGMKGKLRQPKELRKEHAAAIETGFTTTVDPQPARESRREESKSEEAEATMLDFYEQAAANVRRRNAPVPKTTVKTEAKSGSGEEYEDIVDVLGKTVTAANIQHHEPSPHYSEFLWWQYKEALRARFSPKRDAQGQPIEPDPLREQEYRKRKLESLAHIEHETIINEQTAYTMLWCQGTPKTEAGWFTVRPSEEAQRADFCALLGTPNGLSAAHLLVEHGARFGKTAIDSIDYSVRPATTWSSKLFVGDMRIHFR